MKRQEPSTFEIWEDARFDQGERLVAFESWCAEQLATRLQWPSDPAQAQRQVLQCRALVVQAVADMGRHGYLFQPKPLAAMIVAKLDEIAERQRRGEIRDLYPYLKTAWSSYVTGQADQLRQQAMSLGTHISQLSRIADALPLIVAKDREESIREKKQAAAARRKRSCNPAAHPQLDLGIDSDRSS